MPCSNAKSLSLDSVVGETALVRTILNERGTPTTEVFVEQLLSLPSVEEMQVRFVFYWPLYVHCSPKDRPGNSDPF